MNQIPDNLSLSIPRVPAAKKGESRILCRPEMRQSSRQRLKDVELATWEKPQIFPIEMAYFSEGITCVESWSIKQFHKLKNQSDSNLSSATLPFFDIPK